MNKYYFVYYECYRRDWVKSGEEWICCQPRTTTCQDVTNIHPLQWQLDCNEKYAPIIETSKNNKHSEDYKIMSWNELTEEEYNKFEGHIG